MSIKFTDWVMEEQENREDSFLDNCYERVFVIYSYDKNLHLAHMNNKKRNPVAQELRTPKYKSRVVQDKRKKQEKIITYKEDMEQARKFFGE